jgi:hypothetical protein
VGEKETVEAYCNAESDVKQLLQIDIALKHSLKDLGKCRKGGESSPLEKHYRRMRGQCY